MQRLAVQNARSKITAKACLHPSHDLVLDGLVGVDLVALERMANGVELLRQHNRIVPEIEELLLGQQHELASHVGLHIAVVVNTSTLLKLVSIPRQMVDAVANLVLVRLCR